MGTVVCCLFAVLAAAHSCFERARQADVGHGKVFVAHDIVAVAAAGVSIILWSNAMYAHEVSHELLCFETENVSFQPSLQGFLPRFVSSSERPSPGHVLICVLLTQGPRVEVCHDDGRGALVLATRVLRHW